jgi:hypothetical protein
VAGPAGARLDGVPDVAVTRFGRQPGAALLEDRGISLTDAAKHCDVPELHLYNALHGRVRPRPEVRDRLPALCGVEAHDLFTIEVLAQPSKAIGRVAYVPMPLKPWDRDT